MRKTETIRRQIKCNALCTPNNSLCIIRLQSLGLRNYLPSACGEVYCASKQVERSVRNQYFIFKVKLRVWINIKKDIQTNTIILT
jgi:hypothetical protein